MLNENERKIIDFIESKKYKYININKFLYDNPETSNLEFKASDILTKELDKNGFDVRRDIAGHKTGFVASKKSSKTGPKIVFLAEYDALPNIGHGCGHNIIASSGILSGVAIGEMIEELGGEVFVYGTPAEEGGDNGSAKASFIRDGYADNIDVALMIHPSSKTAPTTNGLALDPIDVEFFGKPAHAAASPEDGINALDAVVLLFNGINAMRQQLKDDIRIHGIILEGGVAPNIIPEYTKARFFVRAKKRVDVDETMRKFKAIVEGASLSTGCTNKISYFQNQIDDILHNDIFDQVFGKSLEKIGCSFDTNERQNIGSSDMGNFSYVVPTIQPTIKIGDDLVQHTTKFRDATISEMGEKAIVIGSKALALTALALYENNELLREIKKYFETSKITNK
ncbi:MAG: M20 family metallopeptidase [Lachnospirales bacterium]